MFFEPSPSSGLTRYAPTPSGYLHIGNVLSFVLTATIAQKRGAGILLRIDDLDRERVRDEYLQDIFDTIVLLDLPYDQGPRNVADFKASWSQMHRMPLYEAALDQLAGSGAVFACTCSRSQLQRSASLYSGACRNALIRLDADDSCWRLITDQQKDLKIRDHLGKVHTQYLPDEMQSFVVRKKDRHPAYQLASVIDDLHFGVNLVVRGEDLWASTLAQAYLADQLGAQGFNDIHFLHHPLIMGGDGNKLSKSMGDTSVKYLRENGFAALDIFTLIAQVLGWQRPVADWRTLGDLVYQRLFA